MTEIIDNLIENLKQSEGIEISRVYKDNERFEHYYSVAGFLNGKYFAFYIHKHHQREQYESYIVDHVTDCVKELKELLSELTEIPFDKRKKRVLNPAR